MVPSQFTEHTQVTEHIGLVTIFTNSWQMFTFDTLLDGPAPLGYDRSPLMAASPVRFNQWWFPYGLTCIYC